MITTHVLMISVIQRVNVKMSQKFVLALQDIFQAVMHKPDNVNTELLANLITTVQKTELALL